MIRIRKSKPTRGSRKIRFRELPWVTYLKILTVLVIIGILGYQFFNVRFHAEKLTQAQLNNMDLTKKVSVLTSDLKEERLMLQTSLADQSSELSTLNDQLNRLDTNLSTTQQTNGELIEQINGYKAQIESFKAQNDVLRQKLETILGTASRSGEELSPSPVGKSGLTLTDLQFLTKGTPLAGIEQALLKIEADYNCNALYSLAVAKLESGIGTSPNARNKNNIFGILGKTDWVTYATKSDSVLSFGKIMMSNYFSKGFVTLERIGPRYAEGSTTWAPKAKYHMLNDLRKLMK